MPKPHLNVGMIGAGSSRPLAATLAALSASSPIMVPEMPLPMTRISNDELAALLADKARLDWIDAHPKWWAPRRHVDGYETLSRAAIDAARAVQP